MISHDSVGCPLCGDDAPLFGVVDFNKCCVVQIPLSGIPVYYRKCGNCGFLFSDYFWDWSDSDFKTRIYNDEYIKFDPEYDTVRPAQSAKLIMEVFSAHLRTLYFIDYGGGNGTCARLLRESGVDADTCDIHSGVQTTGGRKADVVTAFEVMEHSNDPRKTLEDVIGNLNDTGVILFSTLLLPDDFSAPNSIGMSWWYIAPRNGHISIYSRTSLELLFRHYGFSIRSFSGGLHIAYRTVPAFARHLIPA